MPTALTANLRQGEMQFLKLYGPTEGNCLLMLNICDFCTAISRNPLQRTQIYNLFFLDVSPINLEGWQLYDWVKKLILVSAVAQWIKALPRGPEFGYWWLPNEHISTAGAAVLLPHLAPLDKGRHLIKMPPGFLSCLVLIEAFISEACCVQFFFTDSGSVVVIFLFGWLSFMGHIWIKCSWYQQNNIWEWIEDYNLNDMAGCLGEECMAWQSSSVETSTLSFIILSF